MADILKKTKNVSIAVGTNNKGKVYEDFTTISHMLVSGTTGSGKTSFVRSALLEIIEQYGPKEVRLILCDSRAVDYTDFNGIPHLLIPVVSDPKKVRGAVGWALYEAKDRIREDSLLGNSVPIYLVIDDCAEILKKDDFQEDLAELLHIARSVNIHCWIVTSTPSSTIFPMNILANVLGRIAFHTASKSVSRSILGENGAESLKMPGEMILRNNNGMARCEAIYDSHEGIKQRIGALIEKYRAEEQLIKRESTEATIDNPNVSKPDLPDDNRDSLFEKAGRYIISIGKANIGQIQRGCAIGFNRAARIMDQLAEFGVVGPEKGTIPRQILMTMEEFDSLIASFQ